MNDYINEVERTLKSLEIWLGQGEGDIASLTDRFADRFTMITPAGSSLDKTGLRNFLQAQQASRRGLRITFDQLKIIHEWPQGAVVYYREQQSQQDAPENIRWATAVFSREEEIIRWLHLQETLQS